MTPSGTNWIILDLSVCSFINTGVRKEVNIGVKTEAKIGVNREVKFIVEQNKPSECLALHFLANWKKEINLDLANFGKFDVKF